jgi:hypothetical protein
MKIKYILLVSIIIVFLNGCSKNSLRDNVDGFMQWTSGNKTPQFFMFANPKIADNFTLQHKDFNVSAPLTYERDWKKMTGWKGGFIYGGAFYAVDQYAYDPNRRIVLGYTFQFTTATYPYEEREIEADNAMYMKNYYIGVAPVNVTIEHYGKENYPCVVIKTNKPKQGKKEKSYSCFKFNSERTMAKKVGIRIVYTKSPTLPKELESLAKEYTYEDLLKRGQRVLDSLYIKDGWDE